MNIMFQVIYFDAFNMPKVIDEYSTYDQAEEYIAVSIKISPHEELFIRKVYKRK